MAKRPEKTRKSICFSAIAGVAVAVRCIIHFDVRSSLTPSCAETKTTSPEMAQKIVQSAIECEWRERLTSENEGKTGTHTNAHRKWRVTLMRGERVDDGKKRRLQYDINLFELAL